MCTLSSISHIPWYLHTLVTLHTSWKSRVNLLMQHYYHTSTNLSRKQDAFLRYLQLQLGMLHNSLLLDYAKWGHLTPLSWVKMLWRPLHHFNIHLHMAYPTIAFHWEIDQVIMKIFHLADLIPNLISGLGQYQVLLERQHSYRISLLRIADILSTSYFHQGAGLRHQHSRFPASGQLRVIGTHGSISGITLPPPGIKSKFH